MIITPTFQIRFRNGPKSLSPGGGRARRQTHRGLSQDLIYLTPDLVVIPEEQRKDHLVTCRNAGLTRPTESENWEPGPSYLILNKLSTNPGDSDA